MDKKQYMCPEIIAEEYRNAYNHGCCAENAGGWGCDRQPQNANQ